MALPTSFGSGSPSGGGGGGSSVLDVFNPSTPDQTSQRTTVAGSQLTTREQLQGVARLIHSGNAQGQAYAENFIKANAHRFTSGELAEYGLDQYVPSDGRNWFQKAAGTAMGAAGHLPGHGRIFGYMGKAVGILGRPQQVAAKSLKAFGEGEAYKAYAWTHNGLGISDEESRIMKDSARERWGDAAKAVTDINGDNDINTREMLNLDKNAGGSGWFGDYVVGALDMGGQIATDPLSYAGGFAGAKEATEQGLGAVRKALGAEVEEGIRKGTIKTLSEADQAKVLNVLRSDEAFASAGKRGKLAGRILGKGDKTGGPFERLVQNALADQAGRSGAIKGTVGAERAAQRSMTAVLNRGEEGIKYFGKTVLPRAKYRAPFEHLGLARQIEHFDNPEVKNIADEMTGIDEKLAKLDRKEASVRSTPAFETAADTRLPEIDAERTALQQRRIQLEETLYKTDSEIEVVKDSVDPAVPKAAKELKQRERTLAALDKSRARAQAELEVAQQPHADAVERLHALQAQRENIIRAELDLNGRITNNNPRLRQVLDQIEEAQKAVTKAEDKIGKKMEKLNVIEAQQNTVDAVAKEAETTANLSRERATLPVPKEKSGASEFGPTAIGPAMKHLPMQDQLAVQDWVSGSIKWPKEMLERVQQNKEYQRELQASLRKKYGPEFWVSRYGPVEGDIINGSIIPDWKGIQVSSATGKDVREYRKFRVRAEDVVAAGSDWEGEIFFKLPHGKKYVDLPDVAPGFKRSVEQVANPEHDPKLSKMELDVPNPEHVNAMSRLRNIEDRIAQTRSKLDMIGQKAPRRTAEAAKAARQEESRISQELNRLENVRDELRWNAQQVPDETGETFSHTNLPKGYLKQQQEFNKTKGEFQDAVANTDAAQKRRELENTQSNKDRLDRARSDLKIHKEAQAKLAGRDIVTEINRLGQKMDEQRAIMHDSATNFDDFRAAEDEYYRLSDQQHELHRLNHGNGDSIEEKIAKTEADIREREKQHLKNVARDKKNTQRTSHRLHKLNEEKEAVMGRAARTPETLQEVRPSAANEIKTVRKQIDRLDKEEERLLQSAADTDAKWDSRIQKRLDKIAEKRDALHGRAEELTMREREIPETLARTRVKGPLDIVGRRLNRISEGAGEKFVTGSAVKRNPNLGPELDKYIKNLRSASEGKANAKLDDAVRIIRNAATKARDEDNLFDKELREVVYPAMETPGGRAQLIEDFKAAGRNAAADYVDTLDAIGRRTGERVIEGGLPPEYLHDPETYLERVFTKEGKRAARKQLGEGTNIPGFQPNTLAQDFAQGGALKPRGWKPEAALPEIQDEAKALLDTRGPVFQQNPSVAVAHRAASVEKSIAQQEFLDGLKQWRGKDGRAVLIDNADEANTRGFKAISTPQGTVYADPGVAKEIERFQDVVLNDEALKSFQRFNQRLTKVWKAYATVPLIGAAFHARNAETNVMLNWMAGMGLTSMRFYGEGAQAQRAMAKAESLMSKDVDFATAIRKVKGVDEDLAKKIEWAREDQIISGSYFHSDLADEAPRLHSRTKKMRALAAVDPRNMHNAAVGPGRFVGSTIEDNARMAHYLWALDKYGSRETAANSVKKYLFDYEDLTAFEKNHLRGPIMPFYTFMRKNTALMARMGLENPGKLSRMARSDFATLDENDEKLAGQSIPGYITKDQHEGPRTFLPSGILGSIETPLSAAAESVDTPGKFLTGDIEGGSRATLNQGGGPVPEALKILTEQTTHQDLYTGGYKASLDEMPRPDAALDILNIFAPAPSKAASVARVLNAGGGKYEGRNIGAVRVAKVINMVAGLNTYAYDDASSEREVSRRFNELQDMIDKVNRGKDPDDPDRVPTLEELEEMGLIPARGKVKVVSGGFGGSGSSTGPIGINPRP